MNEHIAVCFHFYIKNEYAVANANKCINLHILATGIDLSLDFFRRQ